MTRNRFRQPEFYIIPMSERGIDEKIRDLAQRGD